MENEYAEPYGPIKNPPPATPPPIKRVVIKYAIISCLLTIIAQLSFNLLGMSESPQTMHAVIQFVVGVAISVYVFASAFLEYRNQEAGGFVSLGQCVRIGLMISLITGIISGIFTVIYLQFIDPNAMTEIMNAQQSAMEAQGMTEEQMEMAQSFSGIFQNPIVLFLTTVIWTVIAGLILSLLTGLAVRKER